MQLFSKTCPESGCYMYIRCCSERTEWFSSFIIGYFLIWKLELFSVMFLQHGLIHWRNKVGWVCLRRGYCENVLTEAECKRRLEKIAYWGASRFYCSPVRVRTITSSYMTRTLGNKETYRNFGGNPELTRPIWRRSNEWRMKLQADEILIGFIRLRIGATG